MPVPLFSPFTERLTDIEVTLAATNEILQNVAINVNVKNFVWKLVKSFAALVVQKWSFNGKAVN